MKKFFLIAGFIYIFDVLTKVVVRRYMFEGQEIVVLPFFSWVHLKNTGMAFGMLQGHNTLLAILGVALLGFIVWYGFGLQKQDALSAYFLALVFGGALGNLTDRFFFGQVTDFLDFYWGRHHWPAFNVADSAICVGAILLMMRSIYVSRLS